MAGRNDSRRMQEELFHVLLSLLTLLTAVCRGIWQAGMIQDVREKNFSTVFIVFIDPIDGSVQGYLAGRNDSRRTREELLVKLHLKGQFTSC